MSAPALDYSRANLTCNPFTSLSSESFGEVGDLHVWLPEDEALMREVLSSVSGGRKKLFIISGPFGFGKTERLLLLKEFLESRGVFCIYKKIDTYDVFRNINDIINCLEDRKHVRLIKKIKSVILGVKEKPLPNDIDVLSDTLINRLSAFSSSAIFLDEVENITVVRRMDTDLFIQFLENIISSKRNITLVLACIPKALNILRAFYPSLIEKASIYHLRPLTLKDAISLVSKRLSLFRSKPSSDPLFPFTVDSIKSAYKLTTGNPRRMIKILRSALIIFLSSSNLPAVTKEIIYNAARIESPEIKPVIDIPPDKLSILKTLLKSFKNEKFTYISASRLLRKLPTETHELLEDLVREGFLEKDNSKYRLPSNIIFKLESI